MNNEFKKRLNLSIILWKALMVLLLERKSAGLTSCTWAVWRRKYIKHSLIYIYCIYREMDGWMDFSWLKHWSRNRPKTPQMLFFYCSSKAFSSARQPYLTLKLPSEALTGIRKQNIALAPSDNSNLYIVVSHVMIHRENVRVRSLLSALKPPVTHLTHRNVT